MASSDFGFFGIERDRAVYIARPGARHRWELLVWGSVISICIVTILGPHISWLYLSLFCVMAPRLRSELVTSVAMRVSRGPIAGRESRDQPDTQVVNLRQR